MGIVTYRHPIAGFELPLPEEWEQLEGPAPGISLIALEPERGGGFRANVVVTVDEVPEGLDLEGWQSGNEERLPAALQGYLLLDRERLELNGRDVIRRLVHHARPETGSITMEQWAMLVDDRKEDDLPPLAPQTGTRGGLDGKGHLKGVTLTASASTLEYDTLATMFAGIAGELKS